MAISLNKGGRLSLSKEAPDLKKALIGLGWDPRATDGAAFDLDAAFAAGEAAAADALDFDADLARGVKQGLPWFDAAAAAGGHEDDEGGVCGHG